ncbi:hypothetical protein SADUNF_Sadunf03G0071800 [Salix dunnii]|uniref:Uncharacterized protein n=1 Tax=Salix dunnii TaxID=1413687 RepID=A0A835KEE1_9ROSI|nr:hypothetical protein SADUNF_Sadunf03G0071800 [Salix dunnii]
MGWFLPQPAKSPTLAFESLHGFRPIAASHLSSLPYTVTQVISEIKGILGGGSGEDWLHEDFFEDFMGLSETSASTISILYWVEAPH